MSFIRCFYHSFRVHFHSINEATSNKVVIFRVLIVILLRCYLKKSKSFMNIVENTKSFNDVVEKLGASKEVENNKIYSSIHWEISRKYSEIVTKRLYASSFH